MAFLHVDDVEHVYAPNPKLEGNAWAEEYPPIPNTYKWLIHKYTGAIYPNTQEWSNRSDILEPYYGDPYKPGMQVVQEVASAIGGQPANTSDGSELDLV